MQIGFAKEDITPRIGVELYGYSGYLNRYATAVRDRLWARSMAARQGSTTVVLVSCDLVFIPRALASEVRRRVGSETGLSEANIMVHSTHTHSGPCVRVDYQNAYDPPFMALLGRRIARACVEAVANLRKAALFHSEVPCEGMGTNRVYDRFNYGDEALRDGFRPDKPELTDTACHVFRVESGTKVIGFLSYFGCHNVVGGPKSTYLHGDYAGIAGGLIERDMPGCVGLFLQGAEGDVNTAGCCFGNDEVLGALDIMAGRYARSVRNGLSDAKPVELDRLGAARKEVVFSRASVAPAEIRERLAAEERVLDDAAASDTDDAFRWAVLRSRALRSILERSERGESFEETTELQGFRIGPVSLLATPLEVFQAIKNDVVAAAKAPIPLVMSVTNDEQGYAPDHASAQDDSDYAAQTVPLWKHTLPYRNIHEELVRGLLELDSQLDEVPAT